VLLAVLLCDDRGRGVLLWRVAAGHRRPAGLVLGAGFGGAAGILSRLGARAAPEAPNSAFGMLFAGYAGGAFAGPLLSAGIGLSPWTWLGDGLPSRWPPGRARVPLAGVTGSGGPARARGRPAPN